MRCEKCGKEIDKDTGSCGNCGHMIKNHPITHENTSMKIQAKPAAKKYTIVTYLLLALLGFRFIGSLLMPADNTFSLIDQLVYAATIALISFKVKNGSLLALAYHVLGIFLAFFGDTGESVFFFLGSLSIDTLISILSWREYKSFGKNNTSPLKKSFWPKAILISLALIIVFVEVLVWIPRDEYIQIGNSEYIFSKEAQQYLTIVERSDYESTGSVIIIEEPHYDIEAQKNLYQGLNIFFKDNPELTYDTVFLAEGFPSGQRISVQPLINAEPAPDAQMIEQVLDSYLITGYIAYEWKYQNGLPIMGIENEKLYEISARLWLSAQNKDELADAWAYTVTARNENISNLLIEIAGIYQNPMLFVGGRHIHQETEYDFEQARAKLLDSGLLTEDEMKYVEEYQNLGIYDYLKEAKLGYTYVQAKSNSITPEMENKNYETYLKLFEAQQNSDYSNYLQWFVSQNSGVTVRPSVEVASELVRLLSGDATANNNGDEENNEEDENKDQQKDNGEEQTNEVKRKGNELEIDKNITDEEAKQKLENNQDIYTNSQEKAKQIAEEASDGKEPIQEPPHKNGYYWHYHTSDHGGGHVFYGSPVYGMYN